jgi:hypothetical protein
MEIGHAPNRYASDGETERDVKFRNKERMPEKPGLPCGDSFGAGIRYTFLRLLRAPRLVKADVAGAELLVAKRARSQNLPRASRRV